MIRMSGPCKCYKHPVGIRHRPSVLAKSGSAPRRDIVGYHQDAWAEAAFTGIGYDRKVSQSAATAGTPGYPNGAVKPGSATPKGSITVSEIMVDSAGGTLPQWIELYNRSKTDAINLNRWKLEIQNVDSEDLIGRPIVDVDIAGEGDSTESNVAHRGRSGACIVRCLSARPIGFMTCWRCMRRICASSVRAIPS